jgi:hypothetical protein
MSIGTNQTGQMATSIRGITVTATVPHMHIEYHIKKLNPRGNTDPGHWAKEEDLLTQVVKPHKNICPTHIQWHRSFRETGLDLHMCFGVEQTKGFFSTCR